MVRRRDRTCLMCKYIDKNKRRSRCEVHHIYPWRFKEFAQYHTDPTKSCLLCFKHHQDLGWDELQYVKILLKLVEKSTLAYIEKYGQDPYR